MVSAIRLSPELVVKIATVKSAAKRNIKKYIYCHSIYRHH